MRRTQRIVATVAGLWGALASSAHAQSGATIDVRAVKPLVMLLVDTSGSMERMPDESVGTGFPQCSGDPATDERNRWAVTLEALTGTFQGFSCVREDRSSYARAEYDYGYHLPHHKPRYSAQAADGLLDNYLYRLKFGLMTFDGVGTTLHGDTLVPWARWNPNDPFWEQAYGAPGMHSYGRIGRLSFPNCVTDYGINSGARGPGEHAGALIAPDPEDNGPDVLAVNELIQNSLLAVRPFGGTPIAAMLDDLEYFLQHDPAVKQGEDGDPFYACRERYAVLLTDGEPDALFRDSRFKCDTPGGGLEGAPCAPATGSGSDGTPKCECPYPTEVELAARMRAEETLTKLFVVAFNVEGAAALATLDQIAQAGGERDAYRTSAQEDLREVLDGIFANVQRGATSRSVPQVVDDGVPTFLDGKHYEITAGFRLGDHANDPWQGFLYRQRIGCQDSQPTAFPLDPDEGDMFHERLNAQAKTGRTIVTVLPEPEAGVNGTIVSGYYTAPEAYTRPRYNRVLPNNTELSVTEPTRDPPSTAPAELVDFTDTGEKAVPLGLFGPSADPEELRTKVVQYVRGTSTDPEDKRKDKVLADIYHSNPVVLPPLAQGSRHLDTEEEELSAALLQLVSPTGEDYGADGRPGVVFVGTNDGVLHAFNLDTWTSRDGQVVGAGHEFWGFVPPSLFSKLGAAALPTHVEMFDGTPQVRNMMLYREPETRAGVFRTVLVSAVRGAPSFVALDVTRPEQPPIFLWQFSAPNMGLTVATPALAQALIKWSNGSGEGDDGVVERAIAILPGGAGSQKSEASCPLIAGVTQAKFPEGPGSKRSAVRCWKETGRSLYVVDIATGELLQEFDHHHFPSPLTGAVAVDGAGLDVSKAAYFTDQDGVLWRLSMVDPDPSHWKVAPLFDLFHSDTSTNAFKNGRPSSHPPLLSRDPQGNNVIIIGTGDIDNLVDSTAHRVVSLRERRTVVATTLGMNFDGELEVNWEQELEPGESVTGPLSLFDSVVYFGTFVSPQGASVCDLGQSRLWGLHYLEADAPQTGADEEDEDAPVTTGTRAPRPMLVRDPEDEEPEYVRYIESEDLRNSVLLGVNIASEPLCVPGGFQTDPFAPNLQRYQPTGAMTGGNYQLRAMVGGQGGTKAANSELSRFQRTLPVSGESRMVGWGGLIE